MRKKFSVRELQVVGVLLFTVLLGLVVSSVSRKSPPAETAFEQERQSVVFPIDVNRAGLDELVLLPGIGPVKAEAIIRERERTGAFSRVDDLLRVSGIGEKTLESIVEFIVVGEPGEVFSVDGEILFDLNTVSAEELEKIKGIGPVKAASIVEFREKNGPFCCLEMLTEVSGIGETTLNSLKVFLYVSGDECVHSGTLKVNVNRADENELIKLTGVGPVIAAAIIEHRNLHGPFRDGNDLINVRGIGERTLENIIDMIEF